ncbi:MAG: hypothetical protein L3J28_02475 [Candidatus Polarisedimenticolaceae bacterium]|nr:hypothetical protein [Candidatus Polarisedimenticolaceae bacterium]
MMPKKCCKGDVVDLKANYRLPLMAMGMLSLITALWGGLQRLGWDLPTLTITLPANHGALMVGAFLGTVIGLERAVALGRLWGYLGPLLTGLGGILMITGAAPLVVAQLLISAGSLMLSLVFIAFMQRQFHWFLVIMGLGALSWLVGNLLWLQGGAIYEIVWWWMGYLLLTIAGERMELGRMLFLSPTKQMLMLASVTIAIIGMMLTLFDADSGARLLGFSMITSALWLGCFDVARRTVKQTGLPRFIAINLLAGYFWLAVSGLLLITFGADFSGLRYDAVLHAFFLGFVFSMIFGHAPVIFPAVLGRGMLYRPVFYIHVGLLHLVLLLRVGGGLTDALMPRNIGGLLSAITLIIFVLNTVLAIRAHARAAK